MSSRMKGRITKRTAGERVRRRERRVAWIGVLHREPVEKAVTALIDLLDAMDASSEDLEPEEDCCEAREDDLAWQAADGSAADPVTADQGAEPGRALEEDGETWIGQRVDGKGTPVLVRRRRIIAAD